MSHIVDSWIDQKTSVLDKKALNSLIELSLEDQNITEEKKFTLEENSKQLKLQKKDQLYAFKDRVRKLWTEYKTPRQTVQDAHSDFFMYRAGVLQDYENTESFNMAAAARENRYPPLRPPPSFPSCDPVVQAGEAFYPVDPRTGQVKTTVLENPLKFTLSDFEHLIVITPYSNSLHILESVQNILTYGASIGVSRQVISSIFKELIRTYLP